MAKRRQTIRITGISRHRNYSVEELSRIMDKSTVTVRRWFERGLPVMRSQKPALVHGEAFLDWWNTRKAAKQTCQLHECYCVKCRAPRTPAGGFAEYVPMTENTGNLRAICCEDTCGRIMNKRIASRNLAELRLVLDLTVVQASPTIKACG
jgi:hypothetical protein